MSPLQHPHRPRGSHRERVRRHLLGAWAGGLGLFGFSVFHGFNASDSFYRTELIAAWSVAALGFYFGLRAFQRGRHRQRSLAAVALALIISSLLVVTLLNRTPDPMSAPPRAADFGE